MRIIELSLSILTIFIAINYFFPWLSDPLKYKILPIVLVIIAGAQLIFEGFRWQLYPLFIGIVILLLIAITKATGLGASISVGITLVLAIISVTATWVLPVPAPYAITGPHQVGTTVVHLVDSNRQELYGTDPTAPREIMVQVWYPAEPTKDNQRAQWENRP